MAFIISKTISYKNRRKQPENMTKTYYYLVEGYREGEKVKRRTIYCLKESKDLKSRKKAVEGQIEKSKEKIKEHRNEIVHPKASIGWLLSTPWRFKKRMLKWIEEEEQKISSYKIEISEIDKLMSSYPSCS